MKQANTKKGYAEDEISVGNFLQDLRSHWYYFIYAFLFFTVLTVIYVLCANPLYESTASVIVEDPKTPLKDMKDYLSYDLFGRNSTVMTEVDIMEAKSILINTIDRLNLHVYYSNTTTFPYRPIYPNYPFIVKVNEINKYLKETPFDVTILDPMHYQLDFEYTGSDLPNEFTTTGKYSFGEVVKNKYYNLIIYRNDTLPPPEKNTSFEFVVRSQNKLIYDIQQHLKIENVDKDADIINLTYHDNVPQRALDMLNTMNQVYLDLNLKDKESMAATTLKYVDEQLKSTKAILNTSESDLESFKEKFKSVNLSEESKALLDKINEADLEQEKNNIQLTSLDNLLHYVQNHDDLTSLAPSSMGIPDPLLVDLINNFQQLQNKRKNISYGLKSDAPSLKILDQQIADTRSTLIESIKSIQKRMLVTRNALVAQLSSYDVKLRQVPDMQRQLISLQRTLEVNQGVYTYLMQKKAETNIQKASSVSDNKILDNASLSVDPYWPNPLILVILIIFFTGVFPVGYLLAKNILQTVVFSKDDITRYTDIPVMGVIGHSKNKKSEQVVYTKPNSSLAEAFRMITVNLQLNGINKDKKIIVVTSSVGKEGKSFVALNLASVLAMQKNKVVVVGLNLHRPKWYPDFEYRNNSGAGNYLEGTSSIDQIIHKTGISNLDLISSGDSTTNPSELITLPALPKLIEELKSRYDYVIIDAAPMGVVTDTYLLLPLADITLYVVRERLSKLKYINSLDDLSIEKNFSNMNIVLNDSKFGVENGYGHNYAYAQKGKGYYDDEISSFTRLLFRLRLKKR